jgi:hypothetical protein
VDELPDGVDKSLVQQIFEMGFEIASFFFISFFHPPPSA